MTEDLVAALSSQFRVTKEDGGPLSPDKRSGWGVHLFLAHLASGVDLVPGVERMGLLQIDPDETLHILHSMSSVLFDLYSTARRLFAYR